MIGGVGGYKCVLRLGVGHLERRSDAISVKIDVNILNGKAQHRKCKVGGKESLH